MSSVRLALVASVIWRPPSGPPVKFCELFTIHSYKFQWKLNNRFHSTHPNEPRVDGTDQTCFVVERLFDLGHVFFQPHDFQRWEIWRNGKARNWFAIVGITIWNSIQHFFHRFFRSAIIPHCEFKFYLVSYALCELILISNCRNSSQKSTSR